MTAELAALADEMEALADEMQRTLRNTAPIGSGAYRPGAPAGGGPGENWHARLTQIAAALQFHVERPTPTPRHRRGRVGP